MPAPLVADLRTQHFQKLYDAFRSYFAEKLRQDASDVSKFKLHLSTEFFDDLDLYKKIAPVFAEANSNPHEKKAVARAALWDALVTNYFGSFASQVAANLSNRVAEVEEKLDGFCKGKQTGKGSNPGVQKQDDSLGPRGTEEAGC